jgi:hypothetical protein
VDYFFRKNVRDEFPRGDVVEQRPEWIEGMDRVVIRGRAS